MVDNIRSEYNRILTWSDMYEGSSIEAKKMIMRQIIKKVHIGRHYEVKLELSISFTEYQRLYLEEKTPEKECPQKERSQQLRMASGLADGGE